MVKTHGKPKACEYCNVIAAFIGSKCQRCANSEKRYGLPITCQQCKQKCAFDRKDPEDTKKVDGKLLCWLCTLSYKRALAKTKSTDPARHTQVKLSKLQEKRKSKYYVEKRPVRPDITQQPMDESELKKPRKEEQSDHMVALTQLREEIAALNRQLQLKQQHIINKDKEICELKAKGHREEQDIRRRMNDMQKLHEQRVESMQQKIRSLVREVAQLNKRSGRGTAVAPAVLSSTVVTSSVESASSSPAL